MVSYKIFSQIDDLALSAAELFIQHASQSIKLRGIFTTALSGGSTPLSMYSVLASEPYSEQVNWSKVHIFWGDERCVPPNHSESNYRRAFDTFLSKVPLPESNIHRIQAELSPEQAAVNYEEQLVDFFTTHQSQDPNFPKGIDLILLGMGDDGHTASLFPGTPVIDEQTRWVRSVYVERVGAWRITLTAPFINQASNIIFLVAGQAKSWTLQKVLFGAYQPDRYPAQLITKSESTTLWLIDSTAASLF